MKRRVGNTGRTLNSKKPHPPMTAEQKAYWDKLSPARQTLFDEVFVAAEICANNSVSGSADEREAWSGMAARLRAAVKASIKQANIEAAPQGDRP